jgi:hypothetical protein
MQNMFLWVLLLAQHHDHHAMVDQKGDQHMGFSHLSTTHHFQLLPDGGVIEVTAKRGGDKASIAAIQTHLREIAKKFAEGDFAMPEAIHGQVPPGVATLRRLRAKVGYSFGVLPNGGQVVVASKDREAVAAVHEFLRFQIQDHRTGDSLEVAKPRR